jgi:hypothetical protein
MKSDPQWEGGIDDLHIVSVSNYYLQIEQYTSVFGKDRFLVLDFNQLKSNHNELCADVFRFIGASALTFNLAGQIKNPTRYQSRRQKQITQIFKPLSRYAPGSVKEVGNKGLAKVFPSKKVHLSEGQKDKIRTELAPGMNKLKAEFGIEIENWGF